LNHTAGQPLQKIRLPKFLRINHPVNSAAQPREDATRTDDFKQTLSPDFSTNQTSPSTAPPRRLLNQIRLRHHFTESRPLESTGVLAAPSSTGSSILAISAPGRYRKSRRTRPFTGTLHLKDSRAATGTQRRRGAGSAAAPWHRRAAFGRPAPASVGCRFKRRGPIERLSASPAH